MPVEQTAGVRDAGRNTGRRAPLVLSMLAGMALAAAFGAPAADVPFHFPGLSFDLGSGPPPPEPAPADDAQSAQLKRAIAAVTRGDYRPAVTTLKELTAANPPDRYALYLQAVCELALRDWSASETTILRLIERHPGWPYGLLLQGQRLLMLGRPAEARGAFNRAVASHPDVALVFVERGKMLSAGFPKDPARLRAALADLDQAERLGATRGYIATLRGGVYRQLGDRTAAFGQFERALDTPGYFPAGALEGLVELLDEQGKTARADEAIAGQRARANGLGDVAALALVEARHAVRCGRSEGVEQHFRKYLAQRPGDRQAVIDFSGWLESQKRLADARPILLAALVADPTDPKLAATLAWVIADTGGDLAEARRWVEAARQHGGPTPYLADTAAWIEYLAGDARAAWEMLRPALELAPRVPDIAYHAGAISAALGNQADAAKFLDMALKSGGRNFSRRAEAAALAAELAAR